MQIANPLYDSVFKFLIDDLNAAQVLIGGILQRPVKILRQQAQELPINATLPSLGSQLHVLRVDYQAIITDEAGKEHKVLIELQKLRRQQDIGRFRSYLGQNYQKPDLTIEELQAIKDNPDHPDHGKAYVDNAHYLPIITIYIVGFNLLHTEPVIQVKRQLIDQRTQQDIALPADDFINQLSHDMHIVQVNRLPEEEQYDIDRILNIFQQKYRQPNNHWIVDAPDAIKNPHNHNLVDRLMLAMADEHLRNIAEAEQVLEYDLKQAFKHEREQGTERGIELGKLETAKNFYTMGLSVAQIMQGTGLTADQLAEIGIHG